MTAAIDTIRGIIRGGGHPPQQAPEPTWGDLEDDDTAGLAAITDDTPPPAAASAAGTTAFDGMTYWQQLVASWRHARRLARDSGRRDGSWRHRLRTEPVSIQLVIDYADSKCWVPDGHDGGFAEAAGTAFFMAYGIPKVTYHRFQIYKAMRPARAICWIAGRNAAITAALIAAGALTGVEWFWLLAWAVAALTLAPALIAVLLMAATRSRAPVPAQDRQAHGDNPDEEPLA